VNRRAVVLALAAFAAVLVPAADGHAAGFSYAFAMPPQVTAPGMFTGAITPAPAAASPVELARQAATNRLQHRRARVIELTNGQRTRNGLGMLTVRADLQRSAQQYVNHLAADGAFSHTDGSVLADRVTATGYRYRVVGENLALGQTSASSAVAAWMASPDHRANMLDRRFTEMGVGIVQRPDGRLLWCIDFGLPAS
jgi:uncharacterized protein YkwD